MFVYQITFLKSFSEAITTWKKEIGVEIDFSMNNSLKDNFERNVGCSFVVMGSMIDGYLKHIRVVFKNKLSRSRQTGMLQSSAFYFPWQVYSYLAKLAACYGADILSTKKSIDIVITKEETSRKLWHPRRLSGINHITKINFIRIPLENENQNGQRTVYNGKANIVVTVKTTITIKCYIKDERCSLSFYIQRYDRFDNAVDAPLQNILNGVIQFLGSTFLQTQLFLKLHIY